ncbi:MAG: aminodeoxychorismate/anthranilate synthase component II [Verrucomicrobia bacterium]|nr:aminodeoxychorismate/anthranilate synthase component II [Verrucomicrobiota bacterium]
MLLVIDNYDSFTYNLVQYLGELGAALDVRRNDRVSLDEIEALRPEAIVISPGPCTPKEAGISKDVVRSFSGRVPLLGVCLGHQCIGEVFGGVVDRADRLMHGKVSLIHHMGDWIFAGIENPFEATRYHSLIVRKETVPEALVVTAWTDQDEVMGLRHREHPTFGVQFHPESILTGAGMRILGNFLSIAHQSR